MADTDRSNYESTGLFKGIAFTVLMILGAALCNDASLSTQGHFENRSDPSQRIEFKSGSYYSGTARIWCSRTSYPPWVGQADEVVNYHRSGDIITFVGSRGSAKFTISNQGLADASNVVWDRKFSGD